jgi:hypothetical protein
VKAADANFVLSTLVYLHANAAFIWLAGVPALKKRWPFGNLCAPLGITHSDAYLAVCENNCQLKGAPSQGPFQISE